MRVLVLVLTIVLAVAVTNCGPNAYEQARDQCERPKAQGGEGGWLVCGESGDGCRCFALEGVEAGYPVGIKATCEDPQSWPVRKQVLDPKTGAYHDEIVPGQFTQRRWIRDDKGNGVCR